MLLSFVNYYGPVRASLTVYHQQLSWLVIHVSGHHFPVLRNEHTFMACRAKEKSQLVFCFIGICFQGLLGDLKEPVGTVKVQGESISVV